MVDEANKEEEKRVTKADIIGAILGIAPVVGGMVPSLRRKGPEEDYLRRAQEGRGAGAILAQRQAAEAASGGVGATAAGHGKTRALPVREALRQGQQYIAKSKAPFIAAQESQEATRALRGNEFARRSAWRRFGAGLGQGAAGVAAMLAAAKDQGGPGAGGDWTDYYASAGEDPMMLRELTPEGPPGMEQAPGVVEEMAGRGEVLPGQGVSAVPMPLTTGPGLPEPAAELPPFRPWNPYQPVQGNYPLTPPTGLNLSLPGRQMPSEAGQQPSQPQGRPSQGRRGAQEPQGAQGGYFKDTGFFEALGLAQSEPAKLYKSMTEAIDAAAQAEIAEAGYMATSATVAGEMYRQQGPMSVLDPEWVYTQVDLGAMDPYQAERMLSLYGFPVDYDRLRVQSGIGQ